MGVQDRALKLYPAFASSKMEEVESTAQTLMEVLYWMDKWWYAAGHCFFLTGVT